MDRIALALAIIGGLNWGAVGIFGVDMLSYLFGGAETALARTVYTIIGIAAIWCITMLFREREVNRENHTPA
jgi:uncharacterized membrane protein YuzA (DUF378 family)